MFLEISGVKAHGQATTTDRRRRRWRRLLLAGAAVLFLYVALALSTLLLIHPEAIHQKLLAEAPRLFPGNLTFAKVILRRLPVPRIAVRYVQWQLPGHIWLTVEQMVITPRLLPLLRGKLEIAEVRIDRPVMHWFGPVGMTAPTKPVEDPDRNFDIERLAAVINQLPTLLAPSITAWTATVPGVRIALSRGELIIPAEIGGEARLSLRGLTGVVDLSDNQAQLDLSFVSDRQETFTLASHLNLRNQTGEGTLTFHDVQLQHLCSLIFPLRPVRFADSQVSGQFSWVFRGPQTWSASFQGSCPTLALGTTDPPAKVQGGQLSMQFRSEDQRLLVSLDSLTLDAPRVHGSGWLLLDQQAQQVQLAFRGWDLDASALRQTALELLKDSTTTQKVFTIVQGGTVPWITWDAQGPPNELTTATPHIITGAMEHGSILIPGIDLLAKDAQGRVQIVDGVLVGEALAARTERTWGWDGTLLVALKGGDYAFHLDIKMDADLSELHDILRREISHPAFHNEMIQIGEIQGRATGRMVLGESTKNMGAWVDVDDFHLNGRYQRVPYPITIQRGQFHFGDDRVEVEQLAGNIGNSAFSGLNAWIGCGSQPLLRIFSLTGKISVPETHSWLLSYPRLKASLPEIQALQGVFSVTETDLDAPLNGKDPWRFQIKGELEQIKIQTPRLPAPLQIDRAKVLATREQIAIGGCQLLLVDGNLEGTATLRDPFSDKIGIDFVGQGTMGTDSARWVGDALGLPAALRLKTPLQLADIRIRWLNPDQLQLSGALSPANGPQLSLALTHAPGELIIKDLHIQGSGSDATASLSWNKNTLDLDYQGTITSAAVDRLLESNPFLSGWVSGKTRLHLDFGRDRPARVRGALQLEGLTVPWWTAVPFRIDNASLTASGREVGAASASVTIEDNTMELSGKVELAVPIYRLDLRLRSPSLDWNRLEHLWKKAGEGSVEEPDPTPEGKPWELPFRGKIQVDTGSLRYGEHLWQPLDATVTFHRDRVDIGIARGELCGILVSGTMKRSAGGSQLDLQWNAKDQDLDAGTDCLWQRKGMVQGAYNLEGWLKASGLPSTPLSQSHGYLRFVAKDGRIYRLNVLAKILALLNVTELLRGRLPDLATEGFSYESMRAHGDIRDGHLQLSQAIIDGSAMKIIVQGDIDLVHQQLDLTVLVAPLKTVDAVLSYIPLLGRIVTGKNQTLLAFPFSVKGDIKDPDISMLPPTAIGSGILDLLRGVLQ